MSQTLADGRELGSTIEDSTELSELLRSEQSAATKGRSAQLATETSQAFRQDQARGQSDRSTQAMLYWSHGLAHWGMKMWRFAVGLILFELHPDSFLWVAMLNSVSSLTSVLLGAWIGAFLDRKSRLLGASAMYCTQNTGIALSAGSALTALLLSEDSKALTALTSAAILFSACASLGALGSTVAVEKGWVNALHGHDAKHLAKVNAVMRRIDLVCLIASPIAAGLVMTYYGLRVAVVAIICWNMLAWLPEVLLLWRAQQLSPHLRRHKAQAAPDSELAAGSAEAKPQMDSKQHINWLSQTVGGWRSYLQQNILPVTVARAMLAFTVMGFGALMTAYLKWRGMSEARLSMFRGLGAVSGVISTYSFSWLHDKLGLNSTAMIGMSFQICSLIVAVAPALYDKLLQPLPASVVTYTLVSGLAASRFGLWTFDLTVTQRLQSDVTPSELGVVNSVQKSLQNVFMFAISILSLIVWQPSKFVWLMSASCGAVFCAAVLLAAWTSRQTCENATSMTSKH